MPIESWNGQPHCVNGGFICEPPTVAERCAAPASPEPPRNLPKEVVISEVPLALPIYQSGSRVWGSAHTRSHVHLNTTSKGDKV